MISLTTGRLTIQRYDNHIRISVAGGGTPRSDDNFMEMHMDLSMENAGELLSLLNLVGLAPAGDPQAIPPPGRIRPLSVVGD